jgi:hypothetical protein
MYIAEPTFAKSGADNSVQTAKFACTFTEKKPHVGDLGVFKEKNLFGGNSETNLVKRQGVIIQCPAFHY